MIAFTNVWESATDKGRWTARGAAFVAKLKATKAVWFPPEPVKSGKKAAATARKATGRASGKATGTTRKTARKATGAGKKATGGARS